MEPLKKDKDIKVTLTEEEYLAVSENAKNSGMSMSEWARRKLFSSKIRIPEKRCMPYSTGLRIQRKMGEMASILIRIRNGFLSDSETDVNVRFQIDRSVDCLYRAAAKWTGYTSNDELPDELAAKEENNSEDTGVGSEQKEMEEEKNDEWEKE